MIAQRWGIVGLVTLGSLIFGRCVETVGSYRGPWIGLALTMVAGLGLLAFVRERPRADVFEGPP